MALKTTVYNLWRSVRFPYNRPYWNYRTHSFIFSYLFYIFISHHNIVDRKTLILIEKLLSFGHTMTKNRQHKNIRQLIVVLVTISLVTSAMFGGGFVGLALADDDPATTVGPGQDVDIIGPPDSEATSSTAICRGGLDIMFTFDTTGSMGGEIDGAQESLDSFISGVERSGVDARYGVVEFKDWNELRVDLTTDTTEVRSTIDGFSASGGGDIPEDSWDAIDTAVEDTDRISDNKLVIVHVTDARAHDADRSDTSRSELAEKFRDDNIQFILAGDESLKTSELSTGSVENQSGSATEDELNSSFHSPSMDPEQDLYGFTTEDISDGTFVPLGSDFGETLEEEVTDEITGSCAENFEVDSPVSPNVSTDDPLSVTTDIENIGEAGGTQEISAIFEREDSEETEAVDADVSFVFDTTGSMGGQISGAQSSLIEFTDNLEETDGDFEYSLVTFKDTDYTIQERYTDDVDRMQDSIDDMSAFGGGPIHEASYDAVSGAINDLEHRDDAQQVIIHVTDAPARTPPSVDTSQDELVDEINDANAKYILAGPTDEELDGYVDSDDERPTEVERRAERSAFIPLNSGEFGDILTDEISTEVTEVTGSARQTVSLGVGESAATELKTSTSGFPEGKYDVTVRSDNSSANTTTYVVPESSGGVDTATRFIDRTEVTAGTSVNITTTAIFSNETADGAIIESLEPAPSSEQIEVTDADNATVAEYSDRIGELTAGWGDRESVSIEYTLTIPENASVGDEYRFSGTATDREADAERAVTGSNSIKVVEDGSEVDAGLESATRTISDTSVSPGDTVDVTLDAEFNGTGVVDLTERVDPVLPRDSVEIIDSGDGSTFANYRETTGKLSAAYSGVENTTLTYTVTIPEDADDGETYEFSGSDASGDRTISVEDGDITDVTRNVLPSNPAPGSTVTVSLDAEFRDGALSPSITDEITPALDSENVVVSDDDGATISEYQASTGLITANYDGDRDGAVLQYEITIPEDAESGDTYELALRGSPDTETITVGGGVSDPPGVYAGPDGVVGPVGLGDAAADFRAGEITPGELAETAAAFRSGEPVA